MQQLIEEQNMQTENYKLHLYSNDISTQFINFSQRNNINEVIMDIRCQLTRALVTIPIRHRNVVSLNCIFDLEYWIEYYKEKKNNLMSCPGCRGFTKFIDYGVDYQLLNTIAIINKFQLSQHIVTFKIGLTLDINGQHIYFAKHLKDNKKFDIPGSQAIIGVNRIISKQQSKLTKNQQIIQEDLSFTIMKMREYLLQKKQYKTFLKQQQDILQQIGIAISNEYLQNTWLNKIGQNSINNDFIFSIQKVEAEGYITTYLIIHFIHYAIWIDYELYDDNQRAYIPKEQALYLKNSDDKAHYIYIIGGKTYDQKNNFSRIIVPLNPFEQSRKLRVNSLPALPRDGFNFMGGIYEDKLFVFYGQKRILGANNKIKVKSLNSSWKYQGGAWIELQIKLLPRFDGSSFISIVANSPFGQFILFYGGLEKVPDEYDQFLLALNELILGDQKQEKYQSYEINFDQQFKSLSAPILSVAYQPNVQLLLSGEYLKQQTSQKRLAYNFNFTKGEIRQNKIFEPPQFALTPYQYEQHKGIKIFTPIYDNCGAILFGIYYSIIQFPHCYDSNRPKISVIKINLTNGQGINSNILVKLIDYENSRMTQQRAQELIKTLPNNETQKFILN